MMDLRQEYRQRTLEFDFHKFNDAINIQDHAELADGDLAAMPDEEAASYNRDFDKFNDIQQLNFAELRPEAEADE